MTRFLLICAATLLLGATVRLHGQNYPQYSPMQQAPYPPANSGAPYGAPYENGNQQVDGGEAADGQHGAARVSLMQGDVNVQRGEGAQLVAAIANAPLLTHDRLQTGQMSSAEVQLDASNVLRLAQNTDLGFADLQYGRAQIQLGTGTVLYRMLRSSPMQVEIDTSSVGVSPVGPADLRIEVLGDGTTQVTIRSGTAEMYGPQGSQRLEGQRSVLVRGDRNNPEFQDAPLPQLDGLDNWSAQRDQQLAASPSVQYTGSDIAGTQDLDANGSWVPSAEYGQVWAPTTTPSGWAPYSEGQWVYEPYYGWTWVDAAPWGWAPYHYGRWFLNGGRGWCWWPGGGYGVRHFWGPAFVGFFGFGGGGLGWVALAPHEGFHTWWGGGGWRGGGYGGYGRGFAGGVSVKSYRNAGFRGGIITAGAGSFGGLRTRFGFGSREMLSRATPIIGRLPVTPSSSAYRFNERQAVVNPRLSAAAGQRFFQRGQTPSNFSGGYRSQPNGRVAAPAQQYRQASGTAGGWQHFGDPRATSSYRQSNSGPGASNSESGWHQFGRPAQGSQNQSGAGGQNRYPAPQQARPFSNGAGSQNSYQPAPQQRYQAPPQQQRYQAPPQQPRYQAPPPQAQPHYQAPAQPRSQQRRGGGNYNGDGHGGNNSGGGHGESHSQGSSGGGHEGHHR